MDLLLALSLAHALSALLWAGAAAVLAVVLLAAAGAPDAAPRAEAGAASVGRRALRPAALATLATGLALALPAGPALAPWAVLAAAVVLASLAARPLLLAPAFDRAPSGQEAEAAPRALRLALLDLLAQGAALALMALRPGWAETAILAGLLACLLLALALLRSLGDGTLSA